MNYTIAKCAYYRKRRKSNISRTKISFINDGEPWVKKEGGRFEVTMEAYDEAEVCELIGIYMLYLKGKKYNLKIFCYVEITD